MKAEELRIGNIVKLNNPKHHGAFEGRYFEVIVIDEVIRLRLLYPQNEVEEVQNEIGQFIEYIEPVPLSPEMLEKCGFVKDKLKDHYYHPQLPMQILLRYNGTYAGTQLRSRVIAKVDYQLILTNCIIGSLHHLQNLFFSLCQKELEITL